MIERRIREALDALTGGEVPDDLGSAGVAGRFRRRQRRNRVGGVVASAVFVGVAVVGVSQFNGGDADAVATAGIESGDEVTRSADDSGQIAGSTTTIPAVAGDAEVAMEATADRSDGPFEWSRLAGADPTLDVILGLGLGNERRTFSAAVTNALASLTLEEAAHLADVRLSLVEVAGITDVPAFAVTVVAQKLSDGSVRYLLSEDVESTSATETRASVCGGPLRPTGTAYVVETPLPAETTCVEPAFFNNLFANEFRLSVGVDERVTLTSADGIEAVFEVRAPYATLDPTSGGGELGLLISNDEGLILYDPLSGRIAPVVRGGRPVLQAALSPDGSTIAYIEEQDDRVALLVSERGSDEALMVFDQGRFVGNPSWSPDGTTLAFNVVQAIGDSSASSEVWVVDVDSLVAERISEPGFAADGPPQWAPVGSRLVFHDGLALTDGFVLVNESRSRDVVDVGMSVVVPVWSPVGEQIVFWGSPDEGRADIWSVAPDGSGLTRLTDTAFKVASPAWSPDGRHVAFIADTDDGSLLYVVGSGGEVLTLLATDPSQPYAPVWSPDSTQLALQGPSDEIFIVDIDSGARRFTGQFGRVNDWR